MYRVCKINKCNIMLLKKTSDILYKCGKKYDLHHRDNSYIKNLVIIILCALKNDIYLVYNGKEIAATFQTRNLKEQSFLLQKLATVPETEGNGVGSYCLNEIERIAKENFCTEVVCEVYDKSEHAEKFYEYRGYTVYGATETLKYRELKMRKEI